MSASDPLIDVPVRDIDDQGRVIHARLSWRSAAGKLRTLRDLACAGADRDDQYGAPALALDLADGRSGVTALEAVHDWIVTHVRYEDEEIERLESAAFVLFVRQADCDGHAVLQASMVVALGGSAALVPMGGTAADPQHLAIAVKPGGGQVLGWPWAPFDRTELPAGWFWSETTIAARFGESPPRAADRIGPGRADLG